MPKISFDEICSGKQGYVLDTGVTIEDKTITEATMGVSKIIDQLFCEFEGKSKSEVTKFYIGKSHIRTRRRVVFHPNNSNTWKLDHGINARYSDHVKTPYGENGLLVVAVVTIDSIPADCKDNGYITHQEEYALTLEKRLIQKFKYERGERLANKGTDPGKTDEVKSIGYVVYVAFTSGKCSNNWAKVTIQLYFLSFSFSTNYL